MTTAQTVRLLDVEPDLGRYLTAVDVQVLDGLSVPTAEIGVGDVDMHELLVAHRAFGMLVLDGMLVRRISMGDVATLRPLGPGDLVGGALLPTTMLVKDSGWRAAAPTRLAMLEREVLLGGHRAPRLVAGLHARSIEQADRVAVQLAICQLPRVEDRVLSMLWLLAESWGQVTGQGTSLRMRLTHETIGGLIGARRSTVTLAIRQLTDDGAVLRQEHGWLLLEPPAGMTPRATRDPGPALLPPLPVEDMPTVVAKTQDFTERLAELREIRADLESVREHNRERVARELTRLTESRRVSRELRRQARAARRSFARLHHHDDARHQLGTAEWQADDAAPEGLAPAVDGVDD
jgi:CRP/FNR family transcriptional regulator, cyclic AMP receptor protein